MERHNDYILPAMQTLFSYEMLNKDQQNYRGLITPCPGIGFFKPDK